MKGGPRIINLTGHDVTITQGGGLTRVTIPADPVRSRARVVYGDAGSAMLGGKVRVTNNTVDAVDLPAPQPGTFYLVSQLTAVVVAMTQGPRPDVLYPGPNQADHGSVVYGCIGLRRVAEINIDKGVRDGEDDTQAA